MTGPHHPLHSRTVRGFSLVELMVSLTIGLVIAVAAMSAYLGSANASRTADAQSRMNEDAQAALRLLSQQIRLAGGNPVQPNRADAYRRNPVYDPTYVGGTSTAYPTPAPTLSPGYSMSAFSIRGCDGTFSNVATSTALTLDSLTCGGGTTTLPDSIAVSYEADKFDTVQSAAGLASDCVGSALTTTTATFSTGTATTATFAVADNRFYIANSSTSVPSLYCKGISSGTQPLVDNVEDMQLRYGTASTTNTTTTATVAGYLEANQIEPTGTLLANAATAWGRVLTVRICIIVRSENPVANTAASAYYYKCDGTLDTSQTDLRLRRAYSTTVVLRNRRL